MKKLNFPLDTKSKGNIADLHTALKKLKLNIAEDEIARKLIGKSTKNALKDFQMKHKLSDDGKLNVETLSVLNAELFDMHHTYSKTRTKKLYDLLEKIEFPVAAEERKSRVVGENTRNAIKLFQKKYGLAANGQLSETVLDKLHEDVIKKTYSTKTQIGKLQTTIQKVNSIAKLNIEIDPNELKEKTLGTTSKKLIKAFQEKYKLPATGEINKATLDNINSQVGCIPCTINDIGYGQRNMIDGVNGGF
jgi:peptidoglycan hydrolase-like protein with peptidoglycan-binding domain